MLKSKCTLWTNDVETTSIWYNALKDETGWKVYNEGMPLLLELYRRLNIKSTFFFTGYIARLIPDIVRMVLADGHEVGSHGLSHKKEHGFDVMSFENQKEHLTESKKILEDISGQEVISFRAPALRVGQYTVEALIESGYKIDSSVASQRFDMFLSFGGIKKLNWILTPRLPYRASINNIFKRGDSPLIEIPLSAFVAPYVGTTMRIFPGITKLQRIFHHWESTLNQKPVVFDIHPNELIIESIEKRIIERRSANPLSYILQDVVRSKLKIKNLGREALYLYEKQLYYFIKKQYCSKTLKDYCFEKGLL